MKRSPLKRGTSELKRTPLARGTSELKRTPMKRTGWRQFGPPRPTRFGNSKKSRKHGFPPGVRKKVRERSGGWCEMAGTGICAPAQHVATAMHHVVFSSANGPDTAENALDICLRAHDWFHGADAAELARAERERL